MNILVTGSKGQLGTHLRLLDKDSHHRYFFTDVEELDITHKEAVVNYVLHNDIKLVVNCAAYTNVDRAEDEEDVADMINNRAVGILADVMNVCNGFLIHVSTDYVFGGERGNTPFVESVAMNPVGAYGRTKMRGEQAIAASGCRHIIIRTAWLYSEYGKNFLLTMLRLMTERPQISVVFDQVGTPTYAGDLAAVIYHIVENELFLQNEGVYHFSNEGVCSWYDFAVEIARQAGITGCSILPCHSSEFPSKVVRPSFSVLDKTKIKKTFGVTVPHWTDSLHNCYNNILG